MSTVGTPHNKINGNPLNYQGYMKASPDGSQIALALEDSQLFEIFDFDNESGKVSNPITLKVPSLSYPYGVEFSPDGSVFYGSAAGTGKIYQYNLQAGSNEKIQASELIVGETEGSWIGALQLGPDKKIYFTQYNKKKLGVINNPMKLGLECGFSLEGVELSEVGQLGLPTFFQSFFKAEIVEKKTEIFIGKVEKNTSFILKNVYFEYNKADLKPESYVELNKLIDILKNENSYSIIISGHTDNIGNKSYNIDLSTRRANSVGEYLTSKGISKNRINTEGFGSSLPISDNDSPEGRQKNRRVEFKIK